jgi:hypothetical protein
MPRLGLVLALAVIPSFAFARPNSTTPDLGPNAGGTFSRNVLLGVATGVNLLSSSITAYELATGKKALAATGISVLVVAPTLAYTIDAIRTDAGDVLLYGSAAWSAAILTKAIIDLIRFHDPTTQRSNERVIIQPTFVPGGRKPAVGLDFIGRF